VHRESEEGKRVQVGKRERERESENCKSDMFFPTGIM